MGEGDEMRKAKKIQFTEQSVRDYLDHCITLWRGLRAQGDPIAPYYIDAFQSMRTSLFGSLCPPEPEKVAK